MNKLPPDPQHAVLKRIYPWEEYDITMVLQWLYHQANKTGFRGTFEDFKSRYGLYVESTDPQDIYDLIENYENIELYGLSLNVFDGKFFIL